VFGDDRVRGSRE